MYVYYYEDASGLKKAYSNSKDEETFMSEMEMLGLEGYVLDYKKIRFKKPSLKTFRQKNKLLFYKNLHALLISGSTISNSLELLKEQFTTKRQRAFIDRAKSSVESGVQLSVVLSGENDFTDMEITLVRIGEESGELPEALGRVCDFLETQYDLKRKLSTIFIYPAFFMLIVYALGVYLLKEELPQMYEGVNLLDAPWYVSNGIKLSDIAQGITYTQFAVLLIFIVIVGLKLKDLFIGILTKMVMLIKPLREILLQFHNYEFITYLDIMIRSEIPLEKIFYTLKVNSKNPYYKEYERVETEVSLGNTMSESLSEKYFIPLVRGAIMSGEDSGDLAFSTENVKKFLEKETLTNQERLATVIPIIMTVIMAFILLLVMLVFYMPSIMYIQQF